MGVYLIKPKLNTALCLNVSGSGTATNDQNVNVYTSSGSNDQKWHVESLGTSQKVLTAINQSYGLNAYQSGTWNCNIRVVGGNDTDSSVDFISSGDGYYFIKLTNYSNYLHCDGNTSGSNVSWRAYTGGNAQKWSISSTTAAGPSNYVYMTASYTGRTLYIIRTNASNIKLQNLQRKTLSAASIIGINGGFFDPAPSVNVLNVAKNDGNYVGPNTAPYDGSHNNWCGNGIVYRQSTGTLSFAEGQDVLTESALSTIKNLTGSNTWAQGGAGMYLGLSSWTSKAEKNFVNSMSYSSAGRTAIVVDNTTKYVYLIVTTDTTSYTAFRTAIMTFLNLSDGSTASTRYLGLFLDGGGSSQLRAVDPKNTTVSKYIETRALCQVIALRSTT